MCLLRGDAQPRGISLWLDVQNHFLHVLRGNCAPGWTFVHMTTSDGTNTVFLSSRLKVPKGKLIAFIIDVIQFRVVNLHLNTQILLKYFFLQGTLYYRHTVTV